MDSRITWEKLCLELDLIVKEEPKTLVPLMIGVQSVLIADDSLDYCGRSINYMTFELATLCQNKSDLERVDILNHFIFNLKEFQISSLKSHEDIYQNLLFRSVIDQRKGSTLPIACFYIFLAQHIRLPMSLVNFNPYIFVRWTHESKTYYLDLSRNGQILSDDELLKISSQLKGQLDISANELIQKYLQDLAICFRKKQEFDLEHAVLSMLLRLEPNNSRYLGERALTRKRLGHFSEALVDIKRYLSFTEIQNAPEDIRRLYSELMALQSIDHSNSVVH